MLERDLTSDLTVDEVMRRWPTTIRIFLDFRMGCVGCPIAPFHSVAESCREHRLDAAVVLRALRLVAVDNQGSPVPAAG